MANIILDTNFILTCIRNKIDFFEEIKLNGAKIIIPNPVIEEIKRICKTNQSIKFRQEAKIALKILEKNSFQKVNLLGRTVDDGIANFAKTDKKLIVATLDKNLQKKFENQKMIIRGKKKLEVIG